MSKKFGNLFTISAPSGAGKTSLVNALLAKDSQVKVSVSHTTRKKREGEIDGQDYYFVDNKTFEGMREKNYFLESAIVFGNDYGTSKAWVSEQLANGIDVILEIDWQGALQTHEWMKDKYGDTGTGVFILPPSLEALRARLMARGQDNEEVIATRMAQATTEMAHYQQADYLVINDSFDSALDDLQSIVNAKRLCLHSQSSEHQPFLSSIISNLE
tara:strand:+ start:383 stop:1027 length:645 start_codon:yes stop_codon:yes gene_type:complete